MYFYTYKITNLTNGKIYVGVHKTTNLEDGYMGSGTVLKRSFKKYGIDNFKKDILMFHSDETEMFEIEALIVDKDFVDRPDTYNIKTGGFGGWDYINATNSNRFGGQHPNSKKAFIECGKRHHIKMKIDETYNQFVCNKISSSLKETFAKTGGAWLGKTHSLKTINKLKSTFRQIEHQQGEKNSQFGKMWIHSLEEKKSTRINNNEPIPNGWNKGRKMFKN